VSKVKPDELHAKNILEKHLLTNAAEFSNLRRRTDILERMATFRQGKLENIMGNTKRHMISFATRMLIVVAVAVSVSVAATIISIQKHGTTWTSYGITWNIVPVVILTVVLPATLCSSHQLSVLAPTIQDALTKQAWEPSKSWINYRRRRKL